MSKDVVTLYDASTGRKTIMPLREYLYGALISEMPAAYGEEALKAQALCCKTAAARKALDFQGSSQEDADGADIEIYSACNIGYVSPRCAAELWGDSLEEYEKKIQSAVDYAMDKLIVFGSEPIYPAWHAISSGCTEDAVTWWGADIPYLRSADSEWDMRADGFETTAALTREDIEEALGEMYPDICLNDDPEKWIIVNSRSGAGNVVSLSVGGQRVSGGIFRALLNLRSCCFEISPNEGGVILTVKGYGHGVGMSQYGAGCMAARGSSCEEIIRHYFNGAEIVSE